MLPIHLDEKRLTRLMKQKLLSFETLRTLHERLMQRLINDVAKICFKLGGSITSHIRTVHRNQVKGGEVTSWHLDGLAMDIVVDYHGNPRLIDDMKIFFHSRGYRVLESQSGAEGAFHIQYDWPIFSNFKRENYLSHLKELILNYEIEWWRYV